MEVVRRRRGGRRDSEKQESTPKLDKATREHGKFPLHPEMPPLETVDLEADPSEKMRWEYRNLVMQRVFEGRTKSELVAEQLVRHRFQHQQQRPHAQQQRYALSSPLVAALRRPGEQIEPAPELPALGDGSASGDGGAPPSSPA